MAEINKVPVSSPREVGRHEAKPVTEELKGIREGLSAEVQTAVGDAIGDGADVAKGAGEQIREATGNAQTKLREKHREIWIAAIQETINKAEEAVTAAEENAANAQDANTAAEEALQKARDEKEAANAEGSEATAEEKTAAEEAVTAAEENAADAQDANTAAEEALQKARDDKEAADKELEDAQNAEI